jgi:hypothetical protein
MVQKMRDSKGDIYADVPRITGTGKPCWKGYEQYGMKMKKGKEVPNCIPKTKGEGAGPSVMFNEEQPPRVEVLGKDITNEIDRLERHSNILLQIMNDEVNLKIEKYFDGLYKVQIQDILGNTILVKDIVVKNGQLLNKIFLPKNLANGVYRLSLLNDKNKTVRSYLFVK